MAEQTGLGIEIIILDGMAVVDLRNGPRSMMLRRFERLNGYMHNYLDDAVHYSNQVAEMLGCRVKRIDMTK